MSSSSAPPAKAPRLAELHHGASSEDIPLVVREAVAQGRLRICRHSTNQTNGKQYVAENIHRASSDDGDVNDVALFYDLQAFEDSLEALRSAFPKETWRHCLAVKANPLLRMLEMAVQRGFGLECASLFEVELSVKAKCPPALIVFDSPCKTMADLRRALQLHVQINCDDLEEVERVREILATETIRSQSVIGLRVNPLLGFGEIKALSVSDATSKFGVPLTDGNKKEILRLFKQHSFLNALHVHVGSQGCSLEMLASGALTILSLAEEIGGPSRIRVLDIGGGLPTNFSSDETNPSFETYSSVLRKMVPSLFALDCPYTCMTEFGRSMQAKLGWVASGCELVKEAGGRRIAIIHVGSDMFVRTCYCPENFPLRVQVVDGQDFALKQDSLCEQNVVGPLCFGGDKICEAVMLPRIEQGDFIIVRDSGANCLSLWSRHCSRPSPAVFGYRVSHDRRSVSLVQIRRKESLCRVLEFWE